MSSGRRIFIFDLISAMKLLSAKLMSVDLLKGVKRFGLAPVVT